MRFVWFWTFWHWSREAYRDGSLLRSPLPGISSHWDEWLRHEASENDLRDIEVAGRTVSGQRCFIAWLLSRWTAEANVGGKETVRRFILPQLAKVQPFNQWKAFQTYCPESRPRGISAIVLAGESTGNREDVRALDAVLLTPNAGGPAIVTEDFHADHLDLETSRRAALNLLQGTGLLILMGLWIAAGRRPYPRWLRCTLGIAWLGVVGLLARLVFGPDPGARLTWMIAGLVALWAGLMSAGLATAAREIYGAQQQGRVWGDRLKESQIRLWMSGGLTLKGGSAGLPVCLNLLLAVYRTDTRFARRSWLLRELFRRINRSARRWAATGIVTAEGFVHPVMLEPKLKACGQRESIENLLTPRQPGTNRKTISRPVPTVASSAPAPLATSQPPYRPGFAAEQQSLRLLPCRHIAQALMHAAHFFSPGQMVINLMAVATSLVLIYALPDLCGILAPPSAPSVIRPASPSTEILWVSLNTRRPDCFRVVLESRFWRNRQANVEWQGGQETPPRAEIRLVPAISIAIKDPEDGVVWVERRPHLLNRTFSSGERVGRYDLAYLKRLGHE